MTHDILFALKTFEERNNIAVAIQLCSDGSGNLQEFWDDNTLEQFDSLEDLFSTLETVNYKKDEKGICIHPVKRIKK